MNSSFIKNNTILFSIICILTCAPNVSNPYDPSKTKVSAVLKSSTITTINDVTYTDTTGTTVYVGVTSNLPNNIDSARVTVHSSQNAIDTIITLKGFDSLKMADTSWCGTVFNEAGTKPIKVEAFIKNGKIITADLQIIIYPRPVNHRPKLSVTGKDNILGGELCSLYVAAIDTDMQQTLDYSITNKPFGATFSPPYFKWSSPSLYSATDTVVFKVTDNGFPPLSDSQRVIITVTSATVNNPPKWAQDTVNLKTVPGSVLTLSLADKCADPNSDTLKFDLMAGTPVGDIINNTAYSFTPAAKDTGVFYPQIIAKDPAGLSDTVTLKITISALDATPPYIKPLSLASDSATLGTASTLVKILCNDPSGVAWVKCSMDADTFGVTKNDSVYSATVSGLQPNVFNTILFIAIDASPQANKDTLKVHIKYDPNINDASGPVLTKVTGPATGAKVNDANVTLVYTATDASGIDTASWTLNGGASGIITPDATNRYSVKTTLTKSHKNTIIFVAYDKSSNCNRSADTTILDYNRPPVISGAPDTTIQELSTLQFTVSAKDTDSDQVTIALVSALPPGATFNAVTGVFKWVTTSGQTGTSFFSFKATDGIDTTLKTITIVISNVPAPVITTNPSDQVKCLGSPVSFSVTATGSGTLSYQWKNAAGNLTGARYIGATTKDLSINSIAASDTGEYSCVVSIEAVSTASSTVAKLTINKYTVKFNSTSGSAVADQTVLCGNTATTPAAPTQTDFTFVGWYSDVALTSAYSFTAPVTDNDTLYAKWASSAKTLTAFSFASPAATGTITGTNVAVAVPYGTTVTALKATFASTGASVKVGSTLQTSGTTANDFTTPVTYTVVAADGSTQNYVVTVTIQPQPVPVAPTLTAPASNALDVSTSPTLSWNAIASAQTYSVQVSTNNSFSGTLVSSSSGLIVSNFNLAGLSYSTKYYWRACASNGGGQGPWAADSFITSIYFTAVTTGLEGCGEVYTLEGVGSTIFAGSLNGIYRSTNNGASWEIVDTETYTSSIAINGTNIFACSGDYDMLVSNNNGTDWSPVRVSNKIDCLAANNTTVFLKNRDDVLYSSTDNGTTWNNVHGSFPANVQNLRTNGNSLFAAKSNGIYASLDGGSTWNLSSANLSSGLTSNNGTVYAGGSSGVSLSTDNGANWTAVGPSLGTSESITSIAAMGSKIISTTTGYSGYYLYFSPNDGKNWDTHCFIVGNYNNASVISGRHILVGGPDGIARSPLP